MDTFSALAVCYIFFLLLKISETPLSKTE
uniref:Uncharacterized protein n=1 Tax=Rhizophora mucronata TaxID=61149 RepID=A0A2P2QSF2_RHIMU